MNTIKIFIIDDNPGFINAARSFLQTNEQVSIIGFAVSGKEALDHLKGLDPDIVLVDYVMEGLNGVETTHALKQLDPPPKVVVVTQHDISDYKEQALDAGADDFIYKPDFGSHIFPVMDQLLNE